ncbi:MAG: helicase-related protein [Candidatus Puniceispirillaceae bacterium]
MAIFLGRSISQVIFGISAMLDETIKCVLGPTNTGKTFYAVDRMLGHASGMIGFPLRLLARENYDKIVARIGASQVALITGEEKIIPANARYFCCTVEAMPLERDVDCMVIDEIQLAADKERGHVFTDRLLHARGRRETMFLGAETMRPLLTKLFGSAEYVRRDRFSRLSYAGQKKVTRLQRRSAIVTFSAANVYRLAELVRRQRGGAAIVMGALSPRTRNAQVELYQNGDVDFMIATDAIGMGLNMDISHVALAEDTKFDGQSMRHLAASEIAQIAGRAGRHMTDGTFGVTEECSPFEQEIIDQIEAHSFPAVTAIYWRNRKLDFTSIRGLLASLDAKAPYPFLLRKTDAVDHVTLASLAEQDEVKALADNPGRIRLLWDVAQIPDFRNIMTDSHVVMLARIFDDLARNGQLDTSWVTAQINHLDRLDGDIDTLMARISHIRTWTYITHKSGWLEAKQDWQALAKSIEDRLSDELHTRLTQRFVDRRAAHLSRRLKESANLMAAVRLDGTVLVEGEEVGTLTGFTFVPSLNAGVGDSDERAMILSAARKGLPDEIERRVAALVISATPAFSLDNKGVVSWRGAEIARLRGSEILYQPTVQLIDSDLLSDDQKTRIASRLVQFVTEHVQEVLPKLSCLNAPESLLVRPDAPADAAADSGTQAGAEASTDQPAEPADAKTQTAENVERAEPAELSGAAKGILFQLYEGLGTVSRQQLADQMKTLAETDKPLLARMGIRMGVENLFMPDMLKPAPIKLKLLLFSLFHNEWPESGLPPEGRVSFDNPDDASTAYWRVAGFQPIGSKIMRVDMIERVSALVRAAARSGSFAVSDDMMSLAGVGRDEMGRMITDLGFISAGEQASEDPEKPAIQLFQRPKRQKSQQNRPAGRKQGAAPHKQHNAKGGQSRRGGGTASAPSRKPKEIDPNSPFAVLAALKK